MASANDTVITDLCWNCKTYTRIVYTEANTLRSFCKPCALAMPPTSDELALLFLQVTCPFHAGDRVEAWTAGTVFDGIGEVTEVSTDLRNGGTAVFPSFHVKLETKEHDLAPDEAWYTECCLRKLTNDSEQAA